MSGRLTNYHLLVLLSICFFCGRYSEPAPAPQSTAVRLSYVFHIDNPAHPTVRVVVNIDGLSSSQDRLVLAMRPAFQLKAPLFEGAMKASAREVILPVQAADPYSWRIETLGKSALRLEYSVPQVHRELTKNARTHQGGCISCPYVADDHALLLTNVLVVYPSELPLGEIAVRLELPERWAVLAPWQASGPAAFRPGNLESLLNNVIAVGQWDAHQFQFSNLHATVAFAPGQAEAQRAILPSFSKLMDHELRLFGLPPKENYLFLFVRPAVPGMGGSPKSDSIVLFVSPDQVKHAYKQVLAIVAHEFHHVWVLRDSDWEDELRWCLEGFADYYAHLVCARGNIFSWEEFSETVARSLRTYLQNAKRTELSLVQAGGSIFFTDPDADSLIYGGGFLLAAWLDRALRAGGSGKSLDEFMRQYINRELSKSKKAELRSFLDTLAHYAGADIALKVEKFVREASGLNPIASFSEVGVKIDDSRYTVTVDLWRRDRY